jgi:tryptophan halogenase
MVASQHAGVRRFVVVGGGTAGYFAALALKREFPDSDVTLIESSRIPIIGVGEATTTLMPAFLHRQLGIDIVEFYREVRPTWKLGIKFEWGLPGGYSFNYPFGNCDPVEACAQDGTLAHQSAMSMLMAADRVPIVTGEDGAPKSLLPHMPFAYHLENRSFVAYLAKHARRVGIHHIDAEIQGVETSADGESVERLILGDGRELRGDVYVDASGFRALLIDKALGSPYTSFASSLFCDAAVVGEVPQEGPIQPYTTAETMDAGWCWRIPVEGQDHRGYVFSSAHLTVDQARAEMRAKNPRLGDTWSLRFQSGRHREFWKGNTVAVGNAYGFVEPLESTALHMVIIELAYLIAGLRSAATGEPDHAFANQAIGAHWDYLRWFLALHYKFNRKIDNDFWRACRETVDVSGLQPLLDHHRNVGPWNGGDRAYQVTSDPTFGSPGLLVMLLGQQVPCPPAPRTSLSKAEWDAGVSEHTALVDHALTQAQALDLLRRHPELLEELVTFSGSWMVISNLGKSGEWRRLQELVSRAPQGSDAGASASTPLS